MPISRVMALLLAAFLSVSTGCAPDADDRDSPSSRPSPEHVERALLADLQRKAAGSHFPFEVDASAVQYRKLQSRIAPFLTYYWAMYSPPEVSHSRVQSVAVLTRDTIRVLTDLSESQPLLRAYPVPADDDQLLAACSELVLVLMGFAPWAPPRAWTGDPQILHGLGLDEEEHERLLATLGSAVLRLPTSADGSASAVIWFVTPTLTRLATQYECVFRPEAATAAVRVSALDSISRIPVE